jgi:hypothetical protein
MAGTKRKRGNTTYKKVSKRKYAVAKYRPMLPPALRGYARLGGAYGRFGGTRAGETKFFDTALSFNVDNTGEVPATGQLALIPQGVTESTRVGRKCTLRSVQIRADLLFDPVATNVPTTTCIILVQDTQCNGAAAAVTDVMESATLPTSLSNLNNSLRFKVLKRWVHDFNPMAGVDGAYAPVRRHIDYYRKVNIPMEYSSTTGAIGEIRSNNLFLLAGSIGGDDLVAVSGNCRVRYSDA